MESMTHPCSTSREELPAEGSSFDCEDAGLSGRQPTGTTRLSQHKGSAIVLSIILAAGTIGYVALAPSVAQHAVADSHWSSAARRDNGLSFVTAGIPGRPFAGNRLGAQNVFGRRVPITMRDGIQEDPQLLTRKQFVNAIAMPIAALSIVPPKAASAAALYGPSSTEYKDTIGGSLPADRSEFEAGSSGLTNVFYKDIEVGSGKSATPAEGDRVVLDWTGYLKAKLKNNKDTELDDWQAFQVQSETVNPGDVVNINDSRLRFEVGGATIIPALQQGLKGMRKGGVRQIILTSDSSFGYPADWADDDKKEQMGPMPSLLFGKGVLKFFLSDPDAALVDKALLFNVKMVRIDKPGMNGWKMDEKKKSSGKKK